MLDNHIHHGNELGIDVRRIAWKRVVSINRFTSDTAAEVEMLTARMAKLGVKAVLATHWADGGKRAAELAKIVVEMCANKIDLVNGKVVGLF